MLRFILWMFLCTTVFSVKSQTVIGGIGAQLFLDSAGGHTMPRIQSLIQGGSAYDSLRATDYIINVNGNDCKDKDLQTIVSWIRGAAGTTVHVVVADTKEGQHPRNYNLKRVAMQIADPAGPFNDWCNGQALQLKKSGYEIVRTFTSDCGSYFFNFNAEAGGYRIRVYTLEQAAVSSTAAAKVYDAGNEASAVKLTKSPATADPQIAQLDGSITFSRDCIGIVHTETQDDAHKCVALYVIVYR